MAKKIQAVRAARKAKGLTVKELAKASGLSHGTIERIEACKPATVNSLKALSKVLSIPVADMFAEAK